MGGDFVTDLIHLDGNAVLLVTGEVDASTSPMLRDACLQLTAITDRLVLDLSGVSFMDSSALHVLIELRESRDTTSVMVRNASLQVRRLLQITELAHFLEPLPSPTDISGTPRATGEHAEAGEI
jgi:anti-anti-sigma factor